MAHENNKFIDYYQLLGVSLDASTDKIKKAYKKLALKKHPDRNPNNPNAGAEFAILVEAKEILSDKESRKKYNDEYKIYEKQLQRTQQEKIENDKRSDQRKEDIIRLENAEQRAKDKNRQDFYRNYIYKTKKNSIKQELDKFRKLIQEQHERELHEKINKLKEEKLKKKSLIVKLDKKRCNKPYTKIELEKIFKIYGKIMEINMITNGAEIVFGKSKYVLKALNDEETLKNKFYLTLIVYDKNKKTKIKKTKKINQEEKWREFIKHRQNLNHQQYQQLVWDTVEQFIITQKNKNDSHNDIHVMDVD